MESSRRSSNEGKDKSSTSSSQFQEQERSQGLDVSLLALHFSMNSDNIRLPPEARQNKQLTLDDVVRIFDVFDSGNSSYIMSGPNFNSLISALLHIRDEAPPSQEILLNTTIMLADSIKLYDSSQMISGNIEGIPLSDFVQNILYGELGVLVVAAFKNSRDIVASLLTLNKPDGPCRIAKRDASDDTTRTDNEHDDESNAYEDEEEEAEGIIDYNYNQNN